MIRALVTIVCVVCVATVSTAILAAAMLWYRGQLTADVVDAVSAMLRGEEPDTTSVADDEVIGPSADEIVDLRVRRLLGIESREREVDLLVSMVDERARQLASDRARFDERAKQFEGRLQELLDRETAEATSLAQSVLKAQQPPDAVASLMPLGLEESVILVRGLPDRSIARILQQFARSNDEEEVERGREIFEAIARGEPRRSLLEQMATDGGAEPPGAGG